MTSYILVMILLGVMSAYFSATETAFSSLSKTRLKTMIEKGEKKAKLALKLAEDYDRLISTILIGNNIFHAACASLSALLVVRQFGEEYVVYGTIVTTLIVYLFAEMIPKSFAKARSESIALVFASSMVFLVKMLTPVSAIFSGISSLLSRFISPGESKTVTKEELISLIETIEDEGVLESEKQALVNSAIEFGDKLAKDIMIPIDEVVSVASTTPLKELSEIIQTSPYSRLPVYEGSKDKIVGILPVNLFLTHYVSGKRVYLRKLLMKPYVFDQNTEISDLLQRMRLNKLHMVFLVDDKNKKVGMITMEDLLEELVGEIQDESDAGEGLQLV